MRGLLYRFLADERGATAIEYGLIVGLIFVVLLSALTAFADNGTGVFNDAMNAISDAITGALN
jgi:pilus assembly protein Flp/PilA